MKTRAEWSTLEWITCFTCLIASTAIVILIFLLDRGRWALAAYLLGAGLIFSAMSWAPGLLLRPTLPKSLRDMDPVPIPRVASFFFSLGVYCLLAGTVLAWLRGTL